MTDRARARKLAGDSVGAGDPVGWFETLYAEARAGVAVVPWADRVPNPHVAEWLARCPVTSGRALDVGTGLGDNAAALADHGFTVTAFDVSPTAIEEASARFPTPRITFTVADARALPESYRRAFALVVECYTLQVLPPAARMIAGQSLAAAVAPGGTLLVVARAREPGEPEGSMPWPLTRAELEALASDGLRLTSFEDLLDDEVPRVRRFRATFTRD